MKVINVEQIDIDSGQKCKYCNEYNTVAVGAHYCWACFHTIVELRLDLRHRMGYRLRTLWTDPWEE